MTTKYFSSGWDEEGVRRVLAHYETHAEKGALAEDETRGRKEAEP